MNDKRLVFFDVDGVLIHGYHARPELRKCWDENIEHDLGIDREHFTQNFIFGIFTQRVVIGEMDLKLALSEYLSSVKSPVTAAELVDYWLENDSTVNDSLIEKIKLLKECGQVQLLIATNQEHYRADYLMKQIGFNQYFSDIFHSARIGYIKPDRNYFAGVMQKIGESSRPPIFFDDKQNIVDAAIDFGWEAHQFDGVDDLNKSSFIRSLL